MTKYRLKKEPRTFDAYAGKKYYYSVYSSRLGLFWTEEYGLNGYYYNDEDAEIKVKDKILSYREEQRKTKKSKNIRFEI